MTDSFHRLVPELKYQQIGYDEKNAVLHMDNSIEILQFWSEGGYFIVRNNIFPISPGTIIIVNAMETHCSNPANTTKYNRSKIILSSECFKRICDLCDFSKLSAKLFEHGGCMFFLSPVEPTAREADELFLKAEKGYENDCESSHGEVIGAVCLLLSLLSRIPSETIKPVTQKSTSQLMIEYINNHMLSWEKLTLETLCSHLHISPSHAAHLFKELTGKPIARYAMELRMAEARKMLLHTNLKVTHIAELLKFKDSTTFCKTFKKYTGCTPQTWRQENGE